MLAAAVEEFLDTDPSVLPPGTVGEFVLDVERFVRRAQALHAAAVRVFDARDEADAEGAASTAAWLRDRALLTAREASQVVALARSLDRLPLMAAAFSAGAVTAAHARTLAAHTKRIDPETVAAGEPYLVKCAKEFDAHRFGIVVRRWVAAVAPAEFERDTERRFDARWLTVAETFGGMYAISGMLEPEGGAVVHAALEALVQANPGDDARSREQQRADALVDLVELARSHDLLSATGGNRPEILVHASVSALTGEAGTAPPTLGDGQPLTQRALDRLGCDARFRRLLLDPAGVPLDLGRATRHVPPGLRKHVALRDGGCRYPGCPRAVAYCEAHHAIFWRHGGATSADNLVLLCRYHHHLVHDRGHDLKLQPDATVTVTRPDGRVLTSRPRGPTAVPV